MTDHLTDNLLARYRQGALTTKELVEIDGHVSQCTACQARWLENASATNSLSGSLSGHLSGSLSAFRNQLASSHAERTEHLTYEELESLVDETAMTSARALAESHLRDCPHCSAELADLRAFRVELTQETALPHVAPSKPGFWQTLTQRWFVWPVLAAACLLLITLAARVLRTTQPPSAPAAELAAQNPAPTDEKPKSAQPSVEPTTDDLLVKLNDGNAIVTLDRQGQVNGLNELSNAHLQLVRAALTSGKLPASSFAETLGKSPDVLLGPADKHDRFALLTPVGVPVLAARPALRWQALPETSSYRVTVFTTDYEIVLESEPLTVTQWVPPQSLQRNKTYVWQVTANRNGQEIKAPAAPAPEARFRVLDQAKADEITAARRQHPDAHLLLGLLYAQAGLQDEAESELQKLAQLNPDATLPQTLLKDLRSRPRHARR